MYEPEDGLTARLRALGQLPVDSATQSRHLTAMAEAAAAPTLFGTLGNRVRVAVALIVGFMLGTTGLASAGALGPLQPIASTTLEKVGINVPEGNDVGTKRIRSAECTALAGSDEYKNHGQFLKAVRANGGDTAAAAALDCGKPVASLGDDDADDATKDAGDQSEEKGKPESPGKSGEKGKSADKSDNANKANKGAAADDNAKVSDNAQAECAGGADNAKPVEGDDVAEAAPPTSAPAMPECAADEKDGNVPEDPSADHKQTDTESSVGADAAEDKTQDTPGTEQVPSETDTSSDGS